MIIPCKDCLILPICKNRQLIRCQLLYDYRWLHQREALAKLEEILPNWRTKIITNEWSHSR